MKKILSTFLLYTFLLMATTALIGCWSSSKPPVVDSALQIKSLTLFISRASLFRDPEFEQYQLIKGKLFKECGNVRRSKFVAAQQDIQPLDQAEIEAISKEAGSLAQILESDSPSFREPGTNANFADPGQFILNFSTSEDTYEVKTNLDSVTEPFGPAQRALKSLAVSIRKLAGNMCGNGEFYGLGR